VTITRDLPAPDALDDVAHRGVRSGPLKLALRAPSRDGGALRAFGARCSCGCGRRLRHGDRRADRRARTARKLVAEMEALSFGTDDNEYRRAFLFEGVSWRNQYTRVVHGELTSDQILPDAAWIEWRSGVRPAVRQARREPVRVAAAPPREFPRDIVASTQPVVEHARTAAAKASSDELARRIRTMLDGRDGVTEGTTFDAVAWMVNGNVACGVMGDDLLVRVDVSDRDRLLAEAHVHPVTTGTRTMRGFVAVDADAIAGEGELARWLDAAACYAAWLPPK
jgi:hypothetical protein